MKSHIAKLKTDNVYKHMDKKNKNNKAKEWYPGSMLIISHSSMFTDQSGPINMSLVALSANAAALLAIV